MSHPDPPGNEPGLVVSVAADADGLALVVQNRGETIVTLWEQHNSWGWSMPAFEIHDDPTADPVVTLRPGPRRWTRNFPSTISLAADSSMRIAVGSRDLAADSTTALAGLQDTTVWARGRLTVEPSPEAAELGVWCGSVVSELTRLDPPQEWLASLTGS